MERLAARDVARRVEAHVVVAVPPRSCRGLYAREVKFELGFGIGFGFGFGFEFGSGSGFWLGLGLGFGLGFRLEVAATLRCTVRHMMSSTVRGATQ